MPPNCSIQDFAEHHEAKELWACQKNILSRRDTRINERSNIENIRYTDVQNVETKPTKAISDEKFLFTEKVMAELGKLGFEAHFLDLESGRAWHARGHRHIKHQHQAE